MDYNQVLEHSQRRTQMTIGQRYNGRPNVEQQTITSGTLNLRTDKMTEAINNNRENNART